MSGTYEDKRVSRVAMLVFLIISLVVACLPSVGMLWARTDETAENRELAAAPSLWMGDGSLNLSVLADAGAYFDDHFAYRNELVTLNARMRALLGSSATDQVIVGGDGWLYYAGTLNDYLGRSALSDRSLANIAHNLKLAQGYVESKGAAFMLAIAPNKNTLYDANMPLFYVRCPDASNVERLWPLLEREGVKHVNLFDVFSQQDEVLYLLRDTHWDNRGALIAANALLQALGKDASLPNVASAQARDDFIGDLQSMLYPADERGEVNYYFEGYHETDGQTAPAFWAYEEGSDVEESWIRTSSAASGNLLMFRDSFGNALLPFFAAEYGQATFSKLVPYNLPVLSQVQADTVVIERAERHIPGLATDPPIVPNPVLTFKNGMPADAVEAEATVSISTNGPYWFVRGSVNRELGPEDRLYLSVQSEGSEPVVYDPFWVSDANDAGEIERDNGFAAYIPTSSVDLDGATVSVFIESLR